MIIPNLKSTLGDISSALQSALSSSNTTTSYRSQTNDWTIFSEDGSIAIDFDVFISIDVNSENKIMQSPVETGSFAVYNKCVTPTDISLELAVMGDPARLLSITQQLLTMSGELALLNIVTPDGEFKGYNIYKVSYSRTAEDGIDVIYFDLRLMEVRQVEQQYTNAKVAKKTQKGKQNGPESGLSGIKDWLF